MTIFRNGFLVAFLCIACIVGLQVTFLLAQAGGALQDLEISLSGVFSNAGDTLALARRTFAAQQGYYRDSASHVKALTKAAAIDAVELGRLIEHTDARLDRISSGTESTLASANAAASVLAQETQSVGEESRKLLEAGTDATNKAGDLAADPEIKQSLANLEQSSENLKTTTAEASQAMGYIRDMLSPTKKSFWRRLLEMMIPRPTVQIP